MLYEDYKDFFIVRIIYQEAKGFTRTSGNPSKRPDGPVDKNVGN